jgi:hypothetical protein
MLSIDDALNISVEGDDAGFYISSCNGTSALRTLDDWDQVVTQRHESS